MPKKPRPAPKTRNIPLSDLLPRRGRINSMPLRARKALAENIAAGRAYPAMVVRLHPKRAGKYEILDGHQRAKILRSLGVAQARCEVWCVGDAEADLLVVSLNCLRGRLDVRRRASVLRRVVRRLGEAGAAARLALTPTALRQQLAPLKPPQPEDHPPGGKWGLQPVVFHLSEAQSQQLRNTLRTFKTVSRRRGDALMAAMRAATAAASRGGR